MITLSNYDKRDKYRAGIRSTVNAMHIRMHHVCTCCIYTATMSSAEDVYLFFFISYISSKDYVFCAGWMIFRW
ncbi:hypothetical protein BDV40DRAFT_282086 [Aspergillus tamarii]|uniref:Uncharacterized protein n=1 Tax=Aspergillus tamarii TaxID=41984 RepID=A0A5N6UD38_ASPTM|nr:hypothetical protein BDV40DRAFT_282086 [Aspergillus tamarii]